MQALSLLMAMAMLLCGADSAMAAGDAFDVHGQTTLTVQGVGSFAAPYESDSSFHPRQIRETFDMTAFVGARPWRGGEVWVNVEVDQGRGLSDTVGLAGYPSAESFTVNSNRPYLKMPHLFLRQTFALGGAAVNVDAAANQMAQATTANRLIVMAGKIGVIDVFDGNRFAHDPREDFLNWVVVQTGSFDAAANAWGATWGMAADLREGRWAWRAGLYNLAKVAGGNTQGTDFANNEIVLEVERRHRLRGRSGGIRVTANRNREALGRYDAAVAAGLATGQVPDVTQTRRRQSQLSIAMGADQDVTDALSVFLRVGTSDGRIETYDFADVHTSLAVGAAMTGGAWHHPHDTVGLAGAMNGISRDFQRYLAAGGMGAMIGDGRLPHAGDERIIEAYYAYRPRRHATITLDYQHIANPAYNRDRGPVNVFALRLHYAA